MDGTFVKELANQTQRKPFVVEGGVIVAPNDWEIVSPKIYFPDPLAVSSLGALVAYLKENRDNHDLSKVMVVVESPTSVKVHDALEEIDNKFRRCHYLTAVTPTIEQRYGRWWDSDEFIIQLQTQFAQTEIRDNLLALVGGIRDNYVRDSNDDGVSQEVNVVSGVALKNRVKVPNPVVLQPFRTFREVEQPASPFVLRLKKGDDAPVVALFEADGGAWKVDAMQAVTLWLQTELEGTGVAVLGSK